jgi:hypothetical protein
MLTQPNILAAYLYLRTSVDMPAAILDEDGNIDVAADNAAIEAWSAESDCFTVDIDRLQRFIVTTEELLINLENLELDPDEPVAAQYMTLFYDAAKDVFDHDKTQLRTYFAWLYFVIFQRKEGPRWGEFVQVHGVTNFTEFVRERFRQLLT